MGNFLRSIRQEIRRLEARRGEGFPVTMKMAFDGIPLNVWGKFGDFEMMVIPRSANKAVTTIKLKYMDSEATTVIGDRELLTAKDPRDHVIRRLMLSQEYLRKRVELIADSAADNGMYFDEEEA
jgi:hypothetical protein